MAERIIGLDLCDAGTGIAFSDTEKTFRFPSVILRDKETHQWKIGEEAYECALNGKGTITDKLFSFARKHGTATIDGVKYEASEILGEFLHAVISRCVKETGGVRPACAVLCVPCIDAYLVDALKGHMVQLGWERGRVRVISRSESFIYYAMSQPRDVWNNQVSLFDLSDASLTYYEMRVQKNSREPLVYAEKEALEEAFNLEILSTPAGAKLGDRILLSCAERIMKKKLYSGVFLTGRGFEKYDWAQDFMKYVCARRKVFADQDLFARGACVKGAELAEGGVHKKLRCICEGRLDTSVTLNIEKQEKEMAFPIATAGDTWYNSHCSLLLIPDGVSELELTVLPPDTRKRKIVRIPLSFLPERPRKTTRISLSTSFPDEHTLVVELRDAGFGELFPKTDAGIRQEVRLWD